MKTILILINISFALNSFSQEFKKVELLKLTRLGVLNDNTDINNPTIQNDFRKIIKLKKKRNINLGLGMSITISSLVPLVMGSAFINQGIKQSRSNPRENFVLPLGIMFASMGNFGLSTSIPFYVMYSRNVSERKKLLRTYRVF